TILAGSTTAMVTVPILNDNIYEVSESFFVNLLNPVSATITDNQGLGTNRDDGTGTGGTDNDLPTLSVSNVTATEGTDPFAAFIVSLSNPSTQAIGLSLTLANGTALGSGTDFGNTTTTNLQVSYNGGATWQNATTATIPANTTSVLVRTPITNDALDEANE